jgi:hypothetical protein
VSEVADGVFSRIAVYRAVEEASSLGSEVLLPAE